MKYIVELEKGVWVAPWSGCLGRTIVLENAKTFTSIKSAKTALTKARQFRPFLNATVREQKEGERSE